MLESEDYKPFRIHFAAISKVARSEGSVAGQNAHSQEVD